MVAVQLPNQAQDSERPIYISPSGELNAEIKQQKVSQANPQLSKPIPKSNFKQGFVIIITAIAAIAVLIFVIVYFVNKHKQDHESVYDLVRLTSQSARCLDGSKATYHVSQDGDPSKILLYFAGGGWCSDSTEEKTLENCYQRSFTVGGSSSSLSQETTFPQGPHGIVTRGDKNYFKDWKKIHLDYCDGTGHQGYRKDPIQYKGKKLYFRGHNITIQKLKDIENKFGIFTKAQKVVVSGASAGGLAATVWINYIASKMQKGNLYLVSDAGFFYDSISINTNRNEYRQKFKSMMKFSNAEVDPPVPECIQKFPEAKQYCMLSQNLYEFIKTPMFIIQSYYDTWSVTNIIGAPCVLDSLSTCGKDQMTAILEAGQNITKVMQKVAQNKQNGVFGISCAIHNLVTTDNYAHYDFTVPQNSLNTPIEALTQWLQNPDQNNVYLDSLPWPNNRPCA